MKSKRVNKVKRGIIDRYLIADVTNIEVSFKDGTTAQLGTDSTKKVIQISAFPNRLKDDQFRYTVIQNYKNAKSVDVLSELCGYNSTKTFVRNFKKNFNDTPYSWILKNKMENIRILVKHSDMPFNEISDMFNFKNLSHLSHSYKKHFGVTLSEDRLLGDTNL